MTTIFQLNGYYWVAAETLADAKEWYTQTTGEEDFDDPCALGDAELDTFIFLDTEGEFGPPQAEYTFREGLRRKLETEAPPFVFACTEF